MELRDFNIDFIKFRNESHNFEFHLDRTFFTLKENSLYQDGEIDLQCKATKHETTVQLDYKIKGFVRSECERCLDPIKLPIDSEFTNVYKLTLNKEKFGEDNYLSANDQIVNIYDEVYEHIVLSMPSRLICENGIEDKECTIDLADDDEKEIDPRWEELKKLK